MFVKKGLKKETLIVYVWVKTALCIKNNFHKIQVGSQSRFPIITSRFSWKYYLCCFVFQLRYLAFITIVVEKYKCEYNTVISIKRVDHGKVFSQHSCQEIMVFEHVHA